MKKLVFILIIISGLTTYAQDYQYIPIVKPGLQIWTTFFGSESTSGNHYNRFALTEEDTLIENETYKKLYWFHDSVFNASTAECIGGLRENTQRQVFYMGKEGYDTEPWHSYMLCNFSALVGDTLDIFRYPFHSFTVLSIDTIAISGILRRQYNIGYCGYEVFQLIEGIGNNQGLLVNLFSSSSSGFLRCYEYNGELQYHYGKEGCSNTVGLDNIENDKTEVFVFPNPAKDDINFSCSFMIKGIEIYDIMGRRVLKTEVKDYSKTINISSYIKGSYVAKLNTEQGLVSKKFIVE